MTARGVFVTSTGTDIGKTEVSCRLIRQLVERGVDVRPSKPVVTGFAVEDPSAPWAWDGFEASDSGRLLAARGWSPDRLRDVTQRWFRAPLSPEAAARREGRSYGFADFMGGAELESDRFRVVEGVGGVMVPLGNGKTVLDAIVSLDLPVLLVTGTYLGTLSHTITAWRALRAVFSGPAAVVISVSPESALSPEETRSELEPFLGHRPFILPRGGPLTGVDDWVMSQV